MSSGFVTRHELLGLATVEQLKRWRREGVLPRPRQEHLAGHRGSISCYPPDAIRQLEAVKLSLSRSRSFDAVRIDLWWRAHWVDRGRLRDSFRALLDRDRTQDGRAAFEAAEEIAASAARESRDPMARLIRRRLGGSALDATTVYHALAMLGLGAEPEWETLDVGLDKPEPTVVELVELATGVSRALVDRLALDDPWLHERPDTKALLLTLRDAGALDLNDPAALLVHASDDDLDQARDDARRIAEPLGVIAHAAEIIYGRDVAGLGTLRTMASLTTEASGLLRLARTMLVLRRFAPAEAFDAIASACDGAYASARAVIALHDALPQHRRFLRADAATLLADAPAPEVERVHADVAIVLAEHPALAALLDEQAIDAPVGE